MKVSIVTISYNQAQFLEQALLSVIKQDYPNIEYIIVDAGSTDGSREIIKKYENHIDKIIFKPDQGPADGLNKGFSCASGDILGYLNSDDYYLPFSITKIANFFAKNTSIDVVSGNAIVVNDKDQLLRYTYSDKFSLTACAYGSAILIQPSSFFREKVFRETQGFNINNLSNWDGELFIDISFQEGKFARIDEFLSAYRIYESNITGSGKINQKIKDYSDYRFKKIMGRSKNSIDRYFELFYRVIRYITNPKDVYQRIKHGPIYARYKK